MKITSIDGELLFETCHAEEWCPTGMVMQRIELSGLDLRRANLSGVRFIETNFNDCDLSNAQMDNCYVEGVTLFGANLTAVNLRGTSFYLSLALGASFAKANLGNACFFGGSFEDVDFSEANLAGALFGRDNMGGEVNLIGANFEHCRLDGVRFEGCIYSPETRFPQSFSPEQAGLVMASQ